MISYKYQENNRIMDILIAITLPFLGTTFGALMVFFIKEELDERLEKTLLGFASGVMVAASVWSLLIPSMELTQHLEKLSFLPVVIGLFAGFGVLLLIDEIVPHLHFKTGEVEGVKSGLKRDTMLMLAMTIHNFPEGAAAGAMIAGVLNNDATMTMSSALILSLGIAIQNFPEGAVVALPLKTEGGSSLKAFIMGTLSGIVEPIAAIMMIFFAKYMHGLLPYMLSFAAGAMLYVVVEELIPESNGGKHSNIATIGFALGFAIMMVLDITLG